MGTRKPRSVVEQIINNYNRPKAVRDRLVEAAKRLRQQQAAPVQYEYLPVTAGMPTFPLAVQRARLTAERTALIAYLQVKKDAEDWHAVADAAMDLRELDAKLAAIREWAK
jgi:hypothetical protein